MLLSLCAMLLSTACAQTGQQAGNTPFPEKPVAASASVGEPWRYMEQYERTNLLIHSLCDMAANGGGFLLNGDFDAGGDLPDTTLMLLDEIRAWTKVNGIAVFGTRPMCPSRYGKFRFTQKHGTVYGIFLLDPQESPVPDTYWFDGKDLRLKTGNINVLGSHEKACLCREADGRYRIDFPTEFEMPHAVVFEMKME